MAYKDKDKQREAIKEAMRRHRERKQGITSHSASQGITTPEGVVDVVPDNYGQPDCQCIHCKQNKGNYVLNHGAYKSMLVSNELNRVALPGDVDHLGVAQNQGGAL